MTFVARRCSSVPRGSDRARRYPLRARRTTLARQPWRAFRPSPCLSPARHSSRRAVVTWRGGERVRRDRHLAYHPRVASTLAYTDHVVWIGEALPLRQRWCSRALPLVALRALRSSDARRDRNPVPFVSAGTSVCATSRSTSNGASTPWSSAPPVRETTLLERSPESARRSWYPLSRRTRRHWEPPEQRAIGWCTSRYLFPHLDLATSRTGRGAKAMPARGGGARGRRFAAPDATSGRSRRGEQLVALAVPSRRARDPPPRRTLRGARPTPPRAMRRTLREHQREKDRRGARDPRCRGTALLADRIAVLDAVVLLQTGRPGCSRARSRAPPSCLRRECVRGRDRWQRRGPGRISRRHTDPPRARRRERALADPRRRSRRRDRPRPRAGAQLRAQRYSGSDRLADLERRTHPRRARRRRHSPHRLDHRQLRPRPRASRRRRSARHLEATCSAAIDVVEELNDQRPRDCEPMKEGMSEPR